MDVGHSIDDPGSGGVGIRASSARRAAAVGTLVGIPTSVVFLWLAARHTNLDAVWAATKAANLGLLALGVLAVAGVYLAQATRWRVLAATPRPGELGFVEMVVGAVACNNVLPGRLGDLLRIRWLAVAAPMPTGRSLASVALDRGCDVVALFAFLVLTVPFVATADWVPKLVLGAAGVLVGLVALFAAAHVYSRLRARNRRPRGRLRRIARDTLDMLAETGVGRIAPALALSVAAWAAFAVSAWLVARSVSIHMSPTECLFVTALVNLGVAIPSSPGFVGTYQWLVVASLGALSVGRADALAFAILLHASWYVPSTLVGGFLLLFRLDWGFGLRPGGPRSRKRTSGSASRGQPGSEVGGPTRPVEAAKVRT